MVYLLEQTTSLFLLVAPALRREIDAPLSVMSNIKIAHSVSRRHGRSCRARVGVTNAMILLVGLALYAAAGVVIAVAFAVFGVTRVQPMPVSVGARVLIVPGAAALWPYVLVRWLKSIR